MYRKIGKASYDTTTASIVKKNTFSYYGDPKGYEETLYITPKGHYFLYVNGGTESPYTKEVIKPYSKIRAKAFLDA